MNRRKLQSLLLPALMAFSLTALLPEDAFALTVIKVKKPAPDAITNALNAAADVDDDVVIELGKGHYSTPSTINIGQGRWKSLTLRPAKGKKVSIGGDVVLSAKRAAKVKDGAVLARLQPQVRKKVRVVDCAALGLKLSGIRPSGFARKTQPGWSELIVNNRPLSLSRWPNDTMSLIGDVVIAGDEADKKAGRLPVFHYHGDRPARWNSLKDAWIGGYFGPGYADDLIPIAAVDTARRTLQPGMQTIYQFMTGKKFRRWYAANLLEEIDVPGEYVLDAEAGKFYFLPSGKVKTLSLNVLDTPVISITGCANVTIDGLTIENSRGDGIYMENTRDVLVENCTFRNLGHLGVCIGRNPDNNDVRNLRNAGTGNGIRSCRFYDLGAGGVSIGGGNQFTLQPGGNFVENCEFTRFNRIEKSYKPAIWLDGDGNRASSCTIYDAPSMAIRFHGNDHLIEYCDITNVCSEIDDQGAIYYGRNPAARGNVIRYNYFHRLSPNWDVVGIYHDDGACGSEVYGNVFLEAGKYPVLLGGGSDHYHHDNLFIDCPNGIHADNRLQNWAAWMLADDYPAKLGYFHIDRAPYATRYPELKNYFSDNPALPKRNRVEGNLFLRVKKPLDSDPAWLDAKDNWTTDTDPGFLDPANPLRGFRDDAAVHRHLSNLRLPDPARVGAHINW